jgi:hypothetical protein
VDPCSAYSRPVKELKGSKTSGFGTIQQNTAIESLKKAPLEVIPEKGDLDVNKLYQASRQSEAGEELKKSVSVKHAPSFHGSTTSKAALDYVER